MKEILELLEILTKADLSFLLIAPSGHGKTTAIAQLLAKKAIEINDFSTASLHQVLLNSAGNPRIACGDFNVPLSHKASVSGLLVAEMLPLMAEGIKRLGRGTDKISHFRNRKKASFSLAITPRVLSQHMRTWIDIGFPRRIVPVAWHWSESLKRKAALGEDLGYEWPAFSMNGFKPAKLTNKERSSLLELAVKMTKKMKWRYRKDGKTHAIPILEDYASLCKILRRMAIVSSVKKVFELHHLITWDYRRNEIG